VKEKLFLDCFSKIEYELEHAIDTHSKRLIVSNIELFLNYCTRFYDRQFITRDNVHKGILERFENLLNEYFQTDKPQNIGLPAVGYCAGELHLSPGYFGDLIKKETGKTAQEYIQSKIIDIAKEKVFDLNKSVSQIAYELGFKYPQHFTRLLNKGLDNRRMSIECSTKEALQNSSAFYNIFSTTVYTFSRMENHFSLTIYSSPLPKLND
jgi:AraC family transcriptional activator of pobA